MNSSKRKEIFARFKSANPHPTTELEYTNVFELLAAVLLSAQATDAGVNKATRRLFAEANTPAKMMTDVSNTISRLMPSTPSSYEIPSGGTSATFS